MSHSSLLSLPHSSLSCGHWAGGAHRCPWAASPEGQVPSGPSDLENRAQTLMPPSLLPSCSRRLCVCRRDVSAFRPESRGGAGSENFYPGAVLTEPLGTALGTY